MSDLLTVKRGDYIKGRAVRFDERLVPIMYRITYRRALDYSPRPEREVRRDVAANGLAAVARIYGVAEDRARAMVAERSRISARRLAAFAQGWASPNDREIVRLARAVERLEKDGPDAELRRSYTRHVRSNVYHMGA